MSALRKAERRLSDALDRLAASAERAAAPRLDTAELQALDKHLAAAEDAIVRALESADTVHEDDDGSAPY